MKTNSCVIHSIILSVSISHILVVVFSKCFICVYDFRRHVVEAAISHVTHCCSFQNPNTLQYHSSDSYDQSALQAVQLEDGTTAYIHHTVQMPQSDTILAIQADGTVAGLHTGDAAIDPDTISALEQYAAKVLCKAFALSIMYSINIIY